MTLNPEMEEIIKHLEGKLNRAETIESGIQFLTELDSVLAEWRIKKLETFERFDSRASPREIAEKITRGEIPPQFIGQKNEMILRQEIFSLLNTKPLFRQASFEDELFSRIEQLQEVAPMYYDIILDEIREKFSDVERTIQAWKTRTGKTSRVNDNPNPETHSGEM